MSYDPPILVVVSRITLSLNVQVPLEGIQLGMPTEWQDPNASPLEDSPEEDEALLGTPFPGIGAKQAISMLPPQ